MTKSLFCHFFQCMEVKLNEATFLSTSILLRQTFVIKQHPLWSTNSPWIWSQKTFSYFLNLLLLPVRSSSQRNHRVIKVFINKCILAPFQCKHWGSKPTISVSCPKVFKESDEAFFKQCVLGLGKCKSYCGNWVRLTSPNGEAFCSTVNTCMSLYDNIFSVVPQTLNTEKEKAWPRSLLHSLVRR